MLLLLLNVRPAPKAAPNNSQTTFLSCLFVCVCAFLIPFVFLFASYFYHTNFVLRGMPYWTWKHLDVNEMDTHESKESKKADEEETNKEKINVERWKCHLSWMPNRIFYFYGILIIDFRVLRSRKKLRRVCITYSGKRKPISFSMVCSCTWLQVSPFTRNVFGVWYTPSAQWAVEW